MASMRGARFVLGPRSPFHASLRPRSGATNQCFAHPTAVPRRFFVGAAVDGTVRICESVLLGLNSGLGWTLAIPTAALMVSCLRVPIMKYTEKILLRQAAAMHLVGSWKMQIGERTPRERLQGIREHKRIFRDRGIQNWKVWGPPLLTLPVWLAMSEALRRLSGYGSGPLSLVIPRTKATTTPDPNDASSTVTDQMAAALSPADAVSAADTLSDTAQSVASAVDMCWYSSSGEVIINWAAADPTGYVLPVTLGCTMLWNAWPANPAVRTLLFSFRMTEALPLPQKVRVLFQRFLIVFSLVMPAVLAQMPAGILLYYILSMGITRLISRRTHAKILSEKRTKPQPCQRFEPMALRA